MNIERQAKLDAIGQVISEMLDELVENYGKEDKGWIAKYPERILGAVEQVEIDYDAIEATQANRVKEFAE